MKLNDLGILLASHSNSSSLIEVIDFLINFVQKISKGPITIAILVGGYLILTSAGDERKLRSGKKIIVISIICLIFILSLSFLKESFIKFLSEIFK
jgi:hypothetical protein